MLFKQIAPLPATSGNIVTSLTFTGDLFKPKFNSFPTSCSVTTAFTKNETCYRQESRAAARKPRDAASVLFR